MTNFEAAKKACGKNDIDESWVAIISNFNSSYWNDAQDWANDIQIKNAKEIISQIKSLYYSHKDGYQPTGYGNSELNEAINAMENYIKEIKPALEFAGSIGLR